MHLNVPLAKAYARELTRLSRQLKLPDRSRSITWCARPAYSKPTRTWPTKRTFGRP